MIRIICYGDSNTFGFNPADGKRLDKSSRWSGILGELLGEGYKVSEEGCNNRNAFFKNPDGRMQCGREYLKQCFDKHPEFDIFILALGTNDMQRFYNITPDIVTEGLNYFLSSINTVSPNAKTILVSPLLLNKDILKSSFSMMFNEESIKRSIWVRELYKQFAKEKGLELFDMNKYATPSSIDGLHFEPEQHKIIAEEISSVIKSLLT